MTQYHYTKNINESIKVVPLILGVLFPLNKLSITIGSFELTWFFLLLILIVSWKFITCNRPFVITRSVFSFVLLVLLLFISISWGNNASYALIRTIKIIVVAFFCWNIGRVLNNEVRIHTFAFYAALSLAIKILFLIYFYIIIGGHLYIANDIEMLSRSGRNSLALYTLVVFCLSFLCCPSKKRDRILLFISKIIIVLGILLMQSRGLYIASLLFFVLYVLKGSIDIKINKQKAINTIVLIIISISVFYVLLPGNVISSFIDRFSSIVYVFTNREGLSSIEGGGSIIERIGLITQSFQLFLSSPIIGIGNGGYYATVGWLTHNDYLLMLVDLGIIGFAIYLRLLIFIYRDLKNSVFEDERILNILKCALISLYSFFFFINAFDNIAVWTMFGIIRQISMRT